MLATYSLTHLTGKPAQANRIAVVQGFEAKRRTWLVLLAAAFVLISATGLLWPFLGAVALLPGLGAAGGAGAGLTMRSKAEPDRLWVTARRDRMRSDAGRVFVCGQEVDPTRTQVFCLMRASVPNLEMAQEGARPSAQEVEGGW